MFQDINKALEWVMNRKRKGSKYNHFKSVLNDINNIQNAFYTIHVAGTNGKGSTVSFLRDLLINYGYKVGTLQSPHYLSHLDRIRINGNPIPNDKFIKYLNKYYDLIIEKNLSMFEIDFLIMCDYFKEEEIDFAIIEVGMGGRLDSTNVIDNTKLSIITNIDYDHTEVLGDTLEKICIEKCGIIKNNSKVLIGNLNDNLKDIVKNICLERNSEYYEMQEYIPIKNRMFKFNNEEYELKSFGKYQMYNASLALSALEIISNDYSFELNKEINKKAIKNSEWKGRFELINEKPRIILDGAHNPHGINALVESLDELDGSRLIIFSALKRKNYLDMIDILKNNCDKLLITTFNYKGAIEKDDIKDQDLIFEKDYLKYINDNIDKYENIIICGSLYFISEIAQNIDKIKS